MKRFFCGVSDNGQSVLEYALLLLALSMVLVTMGAYMSRSVKAKVLTVQRQVNDAVR